MSRVDELHAVGLHEAILAQEWADLAAISVLDERLKPLAAGFEQIAKQHEIGARMYRGMAQGEIYQQTIQRMGEQSTRKNDRQTKRETKEAKKVNVSKLGKVMTLLMVGLMVFLLGGSMVMAQEVTELTPPPDPLPTSQARGEGEVGTQEPPGDIVVVPVEDGPPVVVIREDDGFKPREWVWVAVIVVLGLLIGSLGKTIIQPLILALAESAPMPIVEVALAGAKAGVTQLSNVAAKTENTIDDAAAAELRTGMADLERQIRELRAGDPRTADNAGPADHEIMKQATETAGRGFA